MEFDHDLLFNFVSVFITILLLFVTSIIVFQKLKLRWPLTVNCWFCNNNTKIWRHQLNWWLCPFCDQYNGFTKSGDYVNSIPEQYKASPDSIKKYCTASQDIGLNESAKNNLCTQCNTNESLKLLKLSEFEPIHEKNYEYEAKEFKHQLEKRYPLCANCKWTVHNVLRKQVVWFAEYKMLLFKHKPFHTIVQKATYSASIFQVISIVLVAMVAYNTDFQLLPTAGIFFQLCTWWAFPTKRRSHDILLMFLWICIFVLLPFKDSKLLKINLESTYLTLEYVTQYHMIMMCAFIIVFMNVKPRFYKSALKNNISFKKIETVDKDPFDSNATITNDDYNFNNKFDNDSSDTVINSQPSINTFNGFTPLYPEATGTHKSLFPQSPDMNPESYMLSTSNNNNTVLFKSALPHEDNMSDNYLLNDSVSTLSTLSLSEDSPKYVAKAPKIFEKKVYGVKNSDIYKKFSNSSGRKSILSPPKLKSVMQASWVAGGYWQEGIEAPSLSRSSSQSSGFGSAGSNFAPSREPSVHELDQCSVVSDATLSCYNSKQSFVGPYYQHGSQFPFTEPKSPVFNQTMRHTPTQSYSPQPLSLPPNHQRNNSTYSDSGFRNQGMNVSDMKNPNEMQMFPSHTTIVTSPVWLSVLLCGSLVLNIIVLCTTLLR